MEFIDLKAQYRALKPVIDERIAAVLNHGRFIMGPEIEELEQALADYVGTRYCIAVSSGTDALQLALMALEIGPGDEVITSPFSFIATAEVIALVGATPVFVDIDARSYNLDPAVLEDAVTSRTRAIMPVSLFGQCADMDAINAIAARHGLPVIEDGAQSFGATYRGRRSGALSEVGCTSFFPAKPLGCYGDGGACFTADAVLAERLRRLRVHGQERQYRHTEIGLNARMDTIQAAVLLAKLPTYDEELAARQRIAERYRDRLQAAAPGLVLPHVAAHATSVFAQFTVNADPRDPYREALAESAIPSAVYYPQALHQQPVFAAAGAYRASGSMLRAERAARGVFSLPMHPFLEADDQDAVVAALARAAERVGAVG